MQIIMPNTRDCIACKGNSPQKYCGKSFCPIFAKAESMFKIKSKVPGKDFFGESPAPFIGRYGYPFVNVGILNPILTGDNGKKNGKEIGNEIWKYDAPRHWADTSYSINEIMDLRSSLINSRFRAGVMETNKLVGISKEIGMASKPVEVEINLKEKPNFRLNNDAYMAPTGPNAKLIKARITSNPKIDTRVDRIVSDTDLKSAEAMIMLYKKGFDENFISRILSVGNLGIGSNRKLVPTRWSITASDDHIGKSIIERVKNHNHSNYLAYFSGYLGNYYLVLMFPDAWSYELFETYMPNASWNQSDELRYTTDYESFSGRKQYAYNCAGGYYAARLPIAEKLDSNKRQASVLAIRVITGEYTVPLGVWVCREAARKAVESRPIEFSSRDLMLIYAKNLLNKKFGIDEKNFNKLMKNSRIIENLTNQVKITKFMS